MDRFRIVAADFDHSCAIWNNIGMCFFGKSKLIAALSCLHRANYLCPLDWKVLINMALVYCALRQFASAYHFAAAAYAVNSNNAIILSELQDFRNAYAAYKKAIKLEPKLWIARYNLAIFESRRSNYKEAASILRELENEGLNYGENKNRLNSEELNQLIEKVRRRFEAIVAIEGSAVPEIKEEEK
uniref:Tetratricopeptide repeat protein n=1 Tax=Meloidogyne floridensis TaxID=298350 RepID=A0A915NXM1_9BILA